MSAVLHTISVFAFTIGGRSVTSDISGGKLMSAVVSALNANAHHCIQQTFAFHCAFSFQSCTDRKLSGAPKTKDDSIRASNGRNHTVCQASRKKLSSTLAEPYQKEN